MGSMSIRMLMRYVYVIRNLINEKVYVGQTKDLAGRKRGHLSCAHRGNDRPLYRSIRKHGEENFSFEILEECADEVINERERHWVAHFDSFNPDKGYNLTSGGEEGNHKRRSEETKRKIRLARKHQVITVEHRQRISEGLLRTSQLESTKRRRRLGQSKRPPCSDETRKKRSSSMKKTFQTSDSRVKCCSQCGIAGHYQQTCEQQS